ncbi:hypothetical protein A2U01_0017405, partial [Trifolium medium]|nr:hypothetical protein [Trifolium medium]
SSILQYQFDLLISRDLEVLHLIRICMSHMVDVHYGTKRIHMSEAFLADKLPKEGLTDFVESLADRFEYMKWFGMITGYELKG